MTAPAGTAIAPWRAARGSVIGLLAWCSVVSAHLVAGGALPSVGAAATTMALAALVGSAFAGRRFDWWRAFLVLLGLQPLLHLTLVAVAGGHRHGLEHATLGWAMPAAHVAAAALAAWWVAAGDQLLLVVVTALRGRPSFGDAVPTGPVTADANRCAHTTPMRPPRVHVGTISRRGPPRLRMS